MFNVLIWSISGPLSDDWMETVDFRSLLDTTSQHEIVDTQLQAPAVQYSQISTTPVVTPATQIVTYTTHEDDDPPRKEGMKLAAFELLKALLTQNQQPFKHAQEVSIAKVEPVVNPFQQLQVVNQPVQPVSPAAEVPNLDFSSFISDAGISFELGDGLDQSSSSIEDLIEIQPELSLDNGDVIELDATDPSIVATIEPIIGVDHDYQLTKSTGTSTKFEVISEPSSPEYTDDLSTIDSSYLSDEQPSSVDSNYEPEFTKIKSKGKRARATPYDPEFVHVSDKKMRKKVQNKNAATRYRVKKRAERETLQEQEVRLSDRNKELKEKVESLTREIKYMKELMNEINKVKRMQKI